MPGLAPFIDGMVSAAALLSRRRNVIQCATRALQDSGEDVSTLTPLLNLLNSGIAESSAGVAAITAAAGQVAAMNEQQTGAADLQGQIQEVQRLAQVWRALTQPGQGGEAEGGQEAVNVNPVVA